LSSSLLATAAHTLNDADAFINALGQRFAIKRLGELHKFVGLNITRDRAHRTIALSQELYACEVVERFRFNDSRPVNIPMPIGHSFNADTEAFDAYLYQRAIGSIMFLMVATRPDLAYAVGVLSRFSATPTASHWSAITRVLRYINATRDLSLVLGGQPDLVGYADAAFADDIASSRSTGAYAFVLGNGAVSWSSKRQSVVALSTTEAEYMAAAYAAKEALWLGDYLRELGIDVGPVLLYGDNTGALALAQDAQFHARTRHIRLRYHFIRECVSAGEIDYRYISTTAMVADALTKPLAVDRFRHLCASLGLIHRARVGVLNGTGAEDSPTS